MNGAGPPPWSRSLADRRAGAKDFATREPYPQWLDDIEANLTTSERAFLRACLVKLSADALEQLANLSCDDAVTALRREMGSRVT